MAGGKPAAPCGTESAYQRHKRRKEAICAACDAAHREHLVQRRQDYRAHRSGRAVEAELVDDDPVVDPERVASRIGDLEATRDVLVRSIEILSQTDPAKIASLSRELRETWREIESLTGEAAPAKEDPFDAFFSGDNVVGFPAAKDREAS